MMGLRLEMSPRLEHRIEQMLKLELKHEMKLLLRQLLKLLQSLRLEGRLMTVNEARRINKSFQDVGYADCRDVAHEMVRMGGLDDAVAMNRMLRAIVGFNRNIPLGGTDTLQKALDEIIYGEAMRRDRKGVGMRLRLQVFPPRGLDGTEDNLRLVLDQIPQEEFGRVVWALTGGWAVELLEGRTTREHHDIDMMVLASDPIHVDTDKITADCYFEVMSASGVLIKRHCLRRVSWSSDGIEYQVVVLCPEFLFVSKFHEKTREQDWVDIGFLVRRFAADWDLKLVAKLLSRQVCPALSPRRIVRILERRDPDTILETLKVHVRI